MQRIETTPEAEQILRPDLTPLDLYAAGFVVRRHLYRGYWCWWRRFGRGASEFSAPYLTLEEVYADARWRMTGKPFQRQQPTLRLPA